MTRVHGGTAHRCSARAAGWLALVVFLLANGGCAGTLLTRTRPDFVGFAPYQGTFVSGYLTYELVKETPQSYGVSLLLVIPMAGLTVVDAGFDSALLPLDLIFWPLGAEKDINRPTILGL